MEEKSERQDGIGLVLVRVFWEKNVEDVAAGKRRPNRRFMDVKDLQTDDVREDDAEDRRKCRRLISSGDP